MKRSRHLKIDFVSDISCPWCVIGLRAMDQALARLKGNVSADVHFQPFELNPRMGADGQDITEHLTQKYSISAAEARANYEDIRQRGAQLGFEFGSADSDGKGRSRVYNTFDAHRLLHWAETVSLEHQRTLKEALFVGYFIDGLNPASHAVLTRMAAEVGLDEARASQILASGEFAEEVRAQQAFYAGQGIRAVPAVIINERHLISGGQPVEVFEQALRQIADEAA